MNQPALSYFQKRMQELGIDPESYIIRERYWEHSSTQSEQPDEIREHKVFEEEDDGSIRINYFTRTGRYAVYKKPGSKSSTRYHQIRHIPGTIDKRGNEIRYRIPRGGGTAPFIPPGLVEKFAAKKTIQTLVLTEGAFKAAKGDLHGLDIIGLPSITHFKDSNTHELHYDVKEIMKVCKVQNVLWLHDGDCRRLTRKFPEENPDVDLYTRPNGFYRTIWNIKKLFEDYRGVGIFYASIKSDEIEGDPKGLDDLYVHFQGLHKKIFEERCNEIRNELNKSSLSCSYFHKFDVTHRLDHVRQWYALQNQDQFYLFHQGKIRDKEFIYNGTKYKYNAENGRCDILVARETKDYVRVGTDYYKWINRPNPHGVTDRVLE